MIVSASNAFYQGYIWKHFHCFSSTGVGLLHKISIKYIKLYNYVKTFARYCGVHLFNIEATKEESSLVYSGYNELVCKQIWTNNVTIVHCRVKGFLSVFTFWHFALFPQCFRNHLSAHFTCFVTILLKSYKYNPKTQ